MGSVLYCIIIYMYVTNKTSDNCGWTTLYLWNIWQGSFRYQLEIFGLTRREILTRDLPNTENMLNQEVTSAGHKLYSYMYAVSSLQTIGIDDNSTVFKNCHLDWEISHCKSITISCSFLSFMCISYRDEAAVCNRDCNNVFLIYKVSNIIDLGT